MSGQMEILKKKVKKWGGAITGITHDYAGGRVVLTLSKSGQIYSFPFKGKNATEATEVLCWSVRNLILCDERGILPFEKTAHEYLQIEGSTEPFVEADDKYFSVLGLSSEASNQEIIKAYKAHARELHPDTFVGVSYDLRKDAEKKFSEMTEAYNAIKKARRF